MGSKSQRKGRAAELELSRILQGYGYPVEAGRAMSYGEEPDLAPVRMDGPGQAGRPAVQGRGPSRVLPPLPLALVRGDEVGGLDGAL